MEALANFGTEEEMNIHFQWDGMKMIVVKIIHFKYIIYDKLQIMITIVIHLLHRYAGVTGRLVLYVYGTWFKVDPGLQAVWPPPGPLCCQPACFRNNKPVYLMSTTEVKVSNYVHNFRHLAEIVVALYSVLLR
ncbi:hypothetical protein CEXT_602501 [Caerostris extrusa]|uniref:Uncharacterized protein n=1 Tax=Caerostris extrusa TaxID=172846 RepID=A0AAV4WMF7_CAEEX|nr:hypothetical protein CEXT_602501 [Caerostris extrusa]